MKIDSHVINGSADIMIEELRENGQRAFIISCITEYVADFDEFAEIFFKDEILSAEIRMKVYDLYLNNGFSYVGHYMITVHMSGENKNMPYITICFSDNI